MFMGRILVDLLQTFLTCNNLHCTYIIANIKSSNSYFVRNVETMQGILSILV